MVFSFLSLSLYTIVNQVFLLNNNSIFSVKCQSDLQIPTNMFFSFRKDLSLILTGNHHLILKKIKPLKSCLSWGFACVSVWKHLITFVVNYIIYHRFNFVKGQNRQIA